MREGRRVNTGELEEGLGRLGFVAGILDYPRPWLAPLYSYLATVPRGVVRTLPPYVLLSLRYLEHSLATSRTVPCARSPRPVASSLRVDAHADDHCVGVGAWLPELDSAGRPRKERSRWLSIMLDHHNAPWAFAKDGQGFRLITSLEAFAVLLGIRFLVPSASNADSSTSLTVVPCYTDNMANGRALSKLFSTKHPLAAIVMELGEELASRNLLANVAWSPRATNEEADALSRGVTAGFSPSLRVHVDLQRVQWHVLREALRWGAELDDGAKERRAMAAQGRGRGRKRARDQRLRVRDPW